MIRRLLISALALAPLPAFASSDAISAIEAAVESRMGALPDVEMKHSHPAYGQPMTCHHYKVTGGTIETIGADAGLSKAGALTLVTTDSELAAALTKELTAALSTPSTARGRESKVWDVATGTAEFADRTSVTLSTEGKTTTVQLERRKPVGDTKASQPASPSAAPSRQRNLDPVSNWSSPGYKTPSAGRGTKRRDD